MLPELRIEERWTLRACAWCIVIAALARFVLAWQVTGFVLVDDAYITLRYARMVNEVGAAVYNPGEFVFGVTSPLWAGVTSLLYAILGPGGIEVGVIAFGGLAWSLAAWRLARQVPVESRFVTILVFLWAPVFVDNGLLGMETPLVVWIAVEAMCAALQGKLRRAAGWAGLLMVARPEGLLFAPALLWAAHANGKLKELAKPLPIGLLLAPGLAWVGFALARYGSVLPQSMVAKSGWNSEHYDGLATMGMALQAIPWLTFLPFVDYLPAPQAVALCAVALVGWVCCANVVRGTVWSRTWLVFYLTYMAFFLLGKGATEASWYAVPSSVALLLAATPAWPQRLVAQPKFVYGMAAALSLASIGLSLKRAPLLRSYVDGYGSCALALNAAPSGRPTADNRVLIGEIGVFGFLSDHPVIDVGALVSPEVLPLKNEGGSLLSLAKDTNARWLVISQIALDRNFYPSVGPVWADEAEKDWLSRCPVVHHAKDKQLIELLDPDLPLAR